MNQMTTRVKTSQLGQSHLIPALGELQRVTVFNNLRAQVRANISWKQARWSRRTRTTSKLTAHTATVHAKFFLLFLLLFLLFVCCCCCCCCCCFFAFIFGFFCVFMDPAKGPQCTADDFSLTMFKVIRFSLSHIRGSWGCGFDSRRCKKKREKKTRHFDLWSSDP